MKKQPVKLDDEEQAISDSYDRGEWHSVKNLRQEMALAKKAAFEGIPYQTLIASILHKYAAGHPAK